MSVLHITERDLRPVTICQVGASEGSRREDCPLTLGTLASSKAEGGA